MRRHGGLVVLGVLVAVGWPIAVAAAETPTPKRLVGGQASLGRPAPLFRLTDTQGRVHSLVPLKGKFVVLEWFNPECPFSKKHYGGNMQRLQRTYTGRGIVWLSIDSSAPGKQGHLTPEQANALIKERHMGSTAVLLDPDGSVGRLYGAKTTPHLFIINPEGVVIYAGAIDDQPSADPADIARATNYVQRALEEAMAGEAVSVPQTKPYGCSVKY